MYMYVRIVITRDHDSRGHYIRVIVRDAAQSIFAGLSRATLVTNRDYNRPADLPKRLNLYRVEHETYGEKEKKGTAAREDANAAL